MEDFSLPMLDWSTDGRLVVKHKVLEPLTMFLQIVYYGCWADTVGKGANFCTVRKYLGFNTDVRA